MKFFGLSDFNHGQTDKLGVLLVNLGTPANPTTESVRSYLKQFLSDPRVVEIPALLWKLILHGVILRIRPARSAANYRKIWTEQGAPLLVHTRQLATRLQEKLGDQVLVEFAMRYGQPSIGRTLRHMQMNGVSRLVVIPLYPQYSGSTTGSVFDEISRELSKFRWVPDLSFVSSYHDHPAYIDACARSVARFQQEHGRPDKLVMSFHGTPKSYLTKGDPYYCHCQKTSRLLINALQLKGEDVSVTFQSRFGKAEWLKPYTDLSLKKLAEDGYQSVQVVCPGFATDCLETLEEIAMENHELFLDAGGQEYKYIPCLNDSDDHVNLMAELVRERTPVDHVPAGPQRKVRARQAGSNK